MSDRILVTTQAEMDAVPKGFTGIVEVRSSADSWIRILSGLYVVAYGTSHVVAYDTSHVVAYGTSHVEAYGTSHVVAYGTSHVVAYDTSHVEARGTSHVVAYGSVQVLKLSKGADITAKGNSRIVTLPSNATEYCDYYGLEVRDGKAITYKAVDGGFLSFYDYAPKIDYRIGDTVTNTCDLSTSESCGEGLHVAYKDWAIRFGMGRSPNFKLIECAVPLDKIVVPEFGDGKVRTSELTVLREVPREEWGFYANWR